MKHHLFFLFAVIQVVLFQKYLGAKSIHELPCTCDSIRIDSIQTYDYYDFVQYFDSSRVILRFGELFLHQHDGTLLTTRLAHHNYETNRPLYNNSISDLTNLSGGNPFAYSSGDSISYYWTLLEMNEYDSQLNWINIPDTLIYYLDLIDVISGNNILTFDSLGVLPHTSKTEFLTHLISSLDSGLVKIRVFSLASSPKIVRVQIRPVFKGNRDRLSISRWDFLEESKITDRLHIVYQPLYSILDRLIDSLVSLPKHSVESAGIDHMGYSIAVNKSTPTTDEYLIKISTKAGNHLSIKIYNSIGMIILSDGLPPNTTKYDYAFHVQNRPDGMYLAVLFDGEHVVALTKFHIFK